MTARSAFFNKNREWVIPQIHYVHGGRGKIISRKKLQEKIASNPLIQEAIRLEPRVHLLIEEAKQVRCVPGYSANELFYDRYKPAIKSLVGFGSPHRVLHTMEHYDALYQAIYELLPGDEFDLYPDGIMPNGMYCPVLQEKYEREYP